MSGAQHTPGPWEAHWDSGDKEIEIVSISEGIVTAQVDYDDAEHDIAEADARLIAAAPCLLEALTEAVNLSEELAERAGWERVPEASAMLDKMCAAIAKAKGEPA